MAEAAATSRTSYDEVLYPGYPFQQTHPDRLATIAALHGLSPAPVTKCRVLELGCGDGGNLIPMAFTLPESQFVGIDLAARPIASGQMMAKELGLRNIELLACDLMEASANLGEFDYIIAHGIYSWVPPAVQSRILELCRRHLAPQGVAYVSYNAYPGYHLRAIMREMMLFHTRAIEESEEKVTQALALLKFILMKFPSEEASRADLYGAVIREQLDDMLGWRRRDTIYHDELAPFNSPVYFHQFMAHAGEYGLQYLSEANFFDTQIHTYPPKVREMLEQFGDEHVVQKEQYIDFLKCRTFRQTLLCRQGLKLTRNISPLKLTEFSLASLAQPVSQRLDLGAKVTEEFRGPKGARLQTDFPLAKAVLLHLNEVAPRALGWDELLDGAQSRLGNAVNGAKSNDDLLTLAEILLAAYGSGVVQLHLHTPRFAAEVSERPVASELSRWQARCGATTVTNLLHRNVEIEDELGRQLLPLLDGTRNHAAIIDELTSLNEKRGIKQPDGTPITERQEIRRYISETLGANLRKLVRMALLAD
jgi:methyltransferase-like protein/2-polyprenyl-3-methyl-5-hydroxy-6-metoxy-1,4-benzoquinol methylase